MAETVKPYDPADLDMDRLQAYAKRVARETRAPLREAINGKQSGRYEGGHEVQVALFGSHWSLLEVMSNDETFDQPRKLGEGQLRKHWILAPDGQLLFFQYEEEFAAFGGTRGSWKVSSAVQPMTIQNVLELDYDHPQTSGGNSRNKERWWGNYSAGRLRAHAPGVGASLALKRLLTTA